jgi:sulfatase modifying factor 1
MMRRRSLGLMAIAVSFATMSACASIVGIDGLTIGECKGGNCGEGGVDTGTGPDGSRADGSLPDAALPDTGCPSAAGPQMTRAGGNLNNFCIDTTEVTVGQYQAFLNATVTDAGPLPPECAWKTGISPGVGGADSLPETGIDWCDAYAYCQWAGKRLCGKVIDSKFVGRVEATDLNKSPSDAWYIACSAAGQLTWPYGSAYQPGVCNILDSGIGKPVPVASEPGCVGGYPGIYDMLGNVAEWFDGPPLPLDAGITGVDAAGNDGGPATDYLVARGGDYSAPDDKATCTVILVGERRLTRSLNIGVRCCSE